MIITARVNASKTSISGLPCLPSADVAIPSKVHAKIKPEKHFAFINYCLLIYNANFQVTLF
jgi:hypothetical protein